MDVQLAKQKILEELNFRSPGRVQYSMLHGVLSEIPEDLLKEALKKLKDESIILESEHQNPLFPDRRLFLYELKDKRYSPQRQWIQIGNKKVPRLFPGDPNNQEDINFYFESLADYANSLEDRFAKKLDEQVKKYYADIAVIFALFVTLFAFISSGIQIFSIPVSMSFWDLILRNLAIALPTLGVTAFLLYLVKRWINK